MSKANTMETDMLELYLQNVAHANIGDAGGLQPSVAAGSLFISLHTADPTEAGNQQSSEATYGAYARQAIARSAGGFDVTGAVGSNVAEVLFPEATSGSETITHFGVGTLTSGAGVLLFIGDCNDVAVSVGIQPRFAAGVLQITEE